MWSLHLNIMEKQRYEECLNLSDYIFATYRDAINDGRDSDFPYTKSERISAAQRQRNEQQRYEEEIEWERKRKKKENKRDYQREWRREKAKDPAFREKSAEASRKYRLNHKDKCRAYDNQYRKTHSEQINARRRALYAERKNKNEA